MLLHTLLNKTIFALEVFTVLRLLLLVYQILRIFYPRKLSQPFVAFLQVLIPFKIMFGVQLLIFPSFVFFIKGGGKIIL